MTATARTAVITAAVVAVSVAGSASAGATEEHHGNGTVAVHDSLRDLQPATADPTDGARASLVMRSRHGHTTVVLRVRGMDLAAAGRHFGAHLHVGACVAGDGAAAGPHYNTDTLAGQVPPRVDASTEVWLDFTVTQRGTGYAVARVPFVPEPGNRAVVVHRDPTDEHGVAGPRLACLPVSW